MKAKTAKNTKIEYLYRDASNYKVYASEVLKGELTFVQKDFLKSDTQDGFIPSQVGLRNLQGELMALDSDNDSDSYDPFGAGDDHVFHELDEVKDTDEEPTLKMTALEFYKKVAKASKGGWNIEAAIQNVMEG